MIAGHILIDDKEHIAGQYMWRDDSWEGAFIFFNGYNANSTHAFEN